MFKKLILSTFALFLVFYLNPAKTYSAVSCPAGYTPYTTFCYRQLPAGGNCDTKERKETYTFPFGTVEICILDIPANAILLPESDLEKKAKAAGPTDALKKFATADNLPANIVSLLLGPVFPIAGFITAIMIVISGIQFVTSKGDPKSAEAAKGRLTYAIIGFIVILLSFAILQIINYLFLGAGIV